ncbi:MAG: VWA domain-containing protein [Candidatus Firestonebacteria bacterium]
MNLTFLNSTMLFALPLILVPVIIHLFSIKNSRVKKFPETKYIALAVKKTITKIRLLQFLLLLLRVLIAALLVFFFARAVLHRNNNSSGQSTAPEAYFLLLDNSCSMGAVNKNTSSFERGKEACMKVLKALRSIDSVSFALVSKGPEVKIKGMTSNLREVENKIKYSELSYKTTSIRSGINLALTALKEVPSVSKQIIVVTDFALHGYSDFAFTAGEPDPQINIVFVDVGEAADNLAVNRVTSAVSSFEDRLKFNVSISGYSESSNNKVPVALMLNGKKAAYGFTDVKPGKNADKVLYADSGESETDTGSAKIEINDALAADNASFFTVSGRQLKKILLVDGDAKISAFLSETFYLNLALNPNQRFSADVVPSVCVRNEFRNKNLLEFKAVVLCNVSELAPVDAKKLMEYVRNGGNLVYFLGDKIDIKSYAALDSSIFPAVIGGEEEGTFKIDEKSASSNHPVLKNAGVEELRKAVFYRIYRLSPKSKCFSFLDFEGINCPLMLEANKLSFNSGKVIIFPFPADRDRTDFPLRNAYVPFMQELAKYLAEGSSRENPVFLSVGDVFKRKFETPCLSNTVEVTNPSGVIKTIVISGNIFEYPFTANPGIYLYKYTDKKGRKSDYFSVNLDTASGESNLRKISSSDLIKLFPPKTSIHTIKSGKNTDSDIVSIVRGEEISLPLLIALLFLLTAEGMLSIRRLL